eukprot:scaffold14138_cov17-Tisochrysis_lutea.AAC.1
MARCRDVLWRAVTKAPNNEGRMTLTCALRACVCCKCRRQMNQYTSAQSVVNASKACSQAHPCLHSRAACSLLRVHGTKVTWHIMGSECGKEGTFIAQ